MGNLMVLVLKQTGTILYLSFLGGAILQYFSANPPKKSWGPKVDRGSHCECFLIATILVKMSGKVIRASRYWVAMSFEINYDVLSIGQNGVSERDEKPRCKLQNKDVVTETTS